MVSLCIRFPLFVWWCYTFATFKENLKKNEAAAWGDAIGEALKLTALGWILSEPIKYDTKPYYEYFRI